MDEYISWLYLSYMYIRLRFCVHTRKDKAGYENRNPSRSNWLGYRNRLYTSFRTPQEPRENIKKNSPAWHYRVLAIGWESLTRREPEHDRSPESKLPNLSTCPVYIFRIPFRKALSFMILFFSWTMCSSTYELIFRTSLPVHRSGWNHIEIPKYCFLRKALIIRKSTLIHRE